MNKAHIIGLPTSQSSQVEYKEVIATYANLHAMCRAHNPLIGDQRGATCERECAEVCKEPFRQPIIAVTGAITTHLVYRVLKNRTRLHGYE